MVEERRVLRNRIDDIVLFSPLTRTQIERIVELTFNDLRARLAERGMSLEVTDHNPQPATNTAA